MSKKTKRVKNTLIKDEHEAKLVQVYGEKDLNKLRDSNAKKKIENGIKKNERKKKKWNQKLMNYFH